MKTYTTFSNMKIGDIYPTTSGVSVTVVGIKHYRHIHVKFNDEYGYEKITRSDILKTGEIANPKTYRQINGKLESVKDVAVGDVRISNNGDEYTVISKVSKNKFKIKFNDAHGYTYVAYSHHIIRGAVNNPRHYPQPNGRSLNIKDFKVGLTITSKAGDKFTVVKLLDNLSATIQFDDEDRYTYDVRIVNALRGEVNNPYRRSVSGIGYLGEGPYPLNNVGYANDIAYNKWRGMIRRCYSHHSHPSTASYKNVYVCNSWHNYQNFATWFYSQEFNDLGHDLDKDLFSRGGNKLYSPQNCCLIPSAVNNALQYIYSDTGITLLKNGRYSAVGHLSDEPQYLGTYDTLLEARLAYQEFTICKMRALANTYADVISDKVYNALINWHIR